jgi:hypothetical protein
LNEIIKSFLVLLGILVKWTIVSARVVVLLEAGGLVFCIALDVFSKGSTGTEVRQGDLLFLDLLIDESFHGCKVPFFLDWVFEFLLLFTSLLISSFLIGHDLGLLESRSWSFEGRLGFRKILLLDLLLESHFLTLNWQFHSSEAHELRVLLKLFHNVVIHAFCLDPKLLQVKISLHSWNNLLCLGEKF